MRSFCLGGEFQENDTNTDYVKITTVKCVRSQSNVGEKIHNCHRVLGFCLSLTDCLDHIDSLIGNGRELTGIIVNLGYVFKGIFLS